MTAWPDLDQLKNRVQPFLDTEHGLFMGGAWQAATGGATSVVLNPATGRPLAQVAAGSAENVDQAVAIARRAFEQGAWPAMAPSARARLLWALAEALEANGDELALLESLNNGKAFRSARTVDIAFSAECLRYNAGWATKMGGESLPVSLPGEWQAYTLREPVGVVGQIVPWNVPLAIAVGKIAPALAAGCIIQDRLTYWRSVGAQASPTVERLIQQAAKKAA